MRGYWKFKVIEFPNSVSNYLILQKKRKKVVVAALIWVVIYCITDKQWLTSNEMTLFEFMTADDQSHCRKIIFIAKYNFYSLKFNESEFWLFMIFRLTEFQILFSDYFQMVSTKKLRGLMVQYKLQETLNCLSGSPQLFKLCDSVDSVILWFSGLNFVISCIQFLS